MDDQPRPLTEHLAELRRRLFWVVGVWLAAAAAAGFFAREVFELQMLPAIAAEREKGHTLLAIAPAELFFTYVKSAFLAGFMVALPVALYHAWAFVSPGLYARERRYALPFVLSATLLFGLGCAFGYTVAFPTIFEWFLSLEGDYVQTAWTTQAVFSFVSRLYLVFGTGFELPIVIVFLALAGIVSPAALARSRRYAVLAMFVVAAILTPADPASQIMLAVPLCVLYEVGIWTARLVTRRRETRTAPAATP